MKRFQVIDCTKSVGCACIVRGRFAARCVAIWLTLRTGRFHDYVPETAWARMWIDLGLNRR